MDIKTAVIIFYFLILYLQEQVFLHVFMCIGFWYKGRNRSVVYEICNMFRYFVSVACRSQKNNNMSFLMIGGLILVLCVAS